MNRALDSEFAQQRDDSKSGGNVEGGLVVVVAVVEHAADARAENARETEGGEEHAVVDACILRTPEISGGGAIHGQLRPVTPVDDEHDRVEQEEVTARVVERGHCDGYESDHNAQDVDPAEAVGHPTRKGAPHGIAAGADYQGHSRESVSRNADAPGERD